MKLKGVIMHYKVTNIYKFLILIFFLLLFFLPSSILKAQSVTLNYTFDALGRMAFVEDTVNGNRDYDYIVLAISNY